MSQPRSSFNVKYAIATSEGVKGYVKKGYGSRSVIIALGCIPASAFEELGGAEDRSSLEQINFGPCQCGTNYNLAGITHANDCCKNNCLSGCTNCEHDWDYKKGYGIVIVAIPIQENAPLEVSAYEATGIIFTSTMSNVLVWGSK